MSNSAQRYNKTHRKGRQDKHQNREFRGIAQEVENAKSSNEKYNLSWFKPSGRQQDIVDAIDQYDWVGVQAPSGCVDKDTEFLSQSGWKKISEYVEGDLVMQVSQEGLNATLVQPIHYIKEPCDTFYTVKTERGVDQWLSLDHNVAYSVRKKDKLNKISVEELIKVNDNNVCGFEGTIATTYNYSGKSLGLTEDEIRLHVAIKADGSFSNVNTKLCYFNLKKVRKIERLQRLLQCAGVEYKLSQSEITGYTKISFYAENCTKSYKDWMFCSKTDAEVIFDEQKYWDGNFETRGNRLPNFNTSSKTDADVMQYIGNICGYRSSVSITDRVGESFKEGTYTRKSVEYRVLFTEQTNIRLLGYNGGVKSCFKQEKSVDGLKYCFTVPSGFLLLRRNGQVFVTGNCGKTTTVVWKALNLLGKGYRKIVFVKNPTEAGDDQIGFLTGNESSKLEPHFESMRGVFLDFMNKGKLESDEKNGNIQFKIPNFLLGATISDAIVILDECQTYSPNTLKLLMERVDDSCKLICLGDQFQQYSVKKRADGFTDLLNRVTDVDGHGRYSIEPLFKYVELTANENKRGAISKRVTELYSN